MSVQRRVKRRHGAARRPGFTMIELIIVVLIGTVIGTIAFPQISKHNSRRSANNARDAFIGAAARARAAAIQTGDQVRLVANPATDVILILDPFDDPVGNPVDFRNGPVRGQILAPASVEICYTPRGFASPGCPPQSDSIVGFISPQGRDTAWARITISQVTRR